MRGKTHLQIVTQKAEEWVGRRADAKDKWKGWSGEEEGY